MSAANKVVAKIGGTKAPGAGLPSMVRALVSQLVTLDNVRNVVFFLVTWRHFTRLMRHLRIYGITTSLFQLYSALSRRVLTLILRTPAARRKVERELNLAIADVEAKLVPRPDHIAPNETLPAYGRDYEWLRSELHKLQVMEAGGLEVEGQRWQDKDGQAVWKGGKISGAVYHGGEDMSNLIADAIKMFMVSNPLHPDVFPGVRRMEAEVVAMVLRLYNAPPSGAGVTTSGGTESILMACKTMKTWGKVVKGITEPEMVIPASAHAAFDKASEYFGIRIHHIPVDQVTRKVKVSDVARAINRNTVLIVGSAPNFPDGAIDDIPSLAALASRHNIGMHVDCCLGSFLVPFLEKAGLPSEPFDFRVEGVTSISCDTHKYGFAPKGSSVVMYRSSELRRHQYYVQPDWMGGVYASPTMAGSRPGSLIAGTWAALMSMGDDGYTRSCREIVGAARQIENAIRTEIPQLRILGKPLVSVIAFYSAGRVNIYEVGDYMSKKGWHLNAIASTPPAVHLAVTRLTVSVAQEFITDLKACVREARNKPAKQGTMASLYGLGSSSAVGPTLVGELSVRFLDTLYKT